MANPTTSYVQNEQPYLFCTTCFRKEYNLGFLSQTVANNGGISANNNQGGSFINNTWTAPTIIYCNRYNSAPAKYPVLAANSTPSQATYLQIGTGYCQGSMSLTAATLGTLDNQTSLNERTTASVG